MLADIKSAFTTYIGNLKTAFAEKSTFSIALALIPMILVILIIWVFKIPVWKPVKKAYRKRQTRRRTRRYTKRRRR